MAIFIFPRTPIDTTGLATEATLLQVETNTADTVTELQDVNTELDTQSTTLSSIDGKVLTDAQLRAAPVAVNGPLTDAELRASPVDVQASSLPLPTGAATETTLASLEAKDFATETTLSSLNSKDFASETTLVSAVQALDTIVASVARPGVAFSLDSVLIDTSSTNIPASSSLPLEIVSSTSADVVKLQTIEDIGEYIGLYIGPASSETFVAVLPLGGGELEITIGSGVRLSLRAMENTAISTGKIAINFLSPQ